MTILVSACLLGVACKYSGGSNDCPALLAALQAGGHRWVPVCPEVYGGLPTPRAPAERRGGRVVTANGADVTPAFRRGAEAALHLARQAGCTAAILKANSPSCGYGAVYDGRFCGRLTEGSGVTAALLAENGIPVYNETNFARLLGAK